MSNQEKITQYIDNISFKKSVFGKVSTSDVQEIICDISSMYNEMLANVYNENERLKRLIDDMDDSGMIELQNEKETQKESSDEMNGQLNAQDEKNVGQSVVENKEVTSLSAEEAGIINKDLKKFKRTELLEILLDQSKENETQKKQITDLERKIIELQKQLEDRTIRINKAGTIAEAAFSLNGVYESTQAAAQHYLDGLEELYDRERRNVIEKEAKTEAYVKMRLEETDIECEKKEKRMADRCAALEHATRERCECMKEEVLQKCLEIEEKTRVRCEMREKEAERKCRELDKKAQSDVEKRWEVLSQRLEDFYHSHDGARYRYTITGDNQSI